MHGANRLGSNSLLEGLVNRLYRRDRRVQVHTKGETGSGALYRSGDAWFVKDKLVDLNDIRNSLKSLMWRDAGIERDEMRLLEAEEMIQMWCSYVLDKEFSHPAGWELQNMLLVSGLIVSAARKRKGIPRRTPPHRLSPDG